MYAKSTMSSCDNFGYCQSYVLWITAFYGPVSKATKACSQCNFGTLTTRMMMTTTMAASMAMQFLFAICLSLARESFASMQCKQMHLNWWAYVGCQMLDEIPKFMTISILESMRTYHISHSTWNLKRTTFHISFFFFFAVIKFNPRN